MFFIVYLLMGKTLFKKDIQKLNKNKKLSLNIIK